MTVLGILYKGLDNMWTLPMTSFHLIVFLGCEMGAWCGILTFLLIAPTDPIKDISPCWRAHFGPRVAWPVPDNIHVSTYRLRLRGRWTNLSRVKQLTSRGVRISSRSAGFQTPSPEFLKDQFQLRFLSRSCIQQANGYCKDAWAQRRVPRFPEVGYWNAEASVISGTPETPGSGENKENNAEALVPSMPGGQRGLKFHCPFAWLFDLWPNREPNICIY